MMKEQEDISVKLWRLADGVCSPEEKQGILKEISENEEWAATWNEIQILNKGLKEIPLEAPSVMFRKKVLAKVAIKRVPRKTTHSLLGARAKWILVGGFVALVLVLAFEPTQTNYTLISSFDLNAMISSMEMNFLSFFENKLPSVSTALLTLLIISLLLFDRWVLADYFRVRHLSRD